MLSGNVGYVRGVGVYFFDARFLGGGSGPKS